MTISTLDPTPEIYDMVASREAEILALHREVRSHFPKRHYYILVIDAGRPGNAKVCEAVGIATWPGVVVLARRAKEVANRFFCGAPVPVSHPDDFVVVTFFEMPDQVWVAAARETSERIEA